ncbi:MAG: lamin tail domain-containing protein [Ignavibacteriae bacterium]|nr:lamin tail domain-containing protein [Ignavibacteriota bacterium]
MIRKSKIFFFKLTLIYQLTLNILFGQNIKLSEIMFAPSSENSEFIEIINVSDSVTIDLSEFKIKYHTSSPDEIISLSNEYLLKPKQFAIIFEADYDFKYGIYEEIASGNSLKFTLDDNAFGSTGMANTSDRNVYLLNAHNDTIDSYLYSADNVLGHSDERIQQERNDWKNSNILNGTPGFINSVSPKEFDLAITEFNFSEYNVNINDEISFEIKIENIGLNKIPEFALNIYKDINLDSIQQQNEKILTQEIFNLDSAQTITYEENLSNITKGINQFIAGVIFVNDGDSTNNKIISVINGIEVNEIKGDVIINEIMYAPINDEIEWIEIYNKSENNISIENFYLADKSDTILISTNYSIKSKEYLVIAEDEIIKNIYPNLEELIITNIPTLNNSDDKIILLDSYKRNIDSVHYFSVWGGINGKSLERINENQNSNDPTNWKSCFYPTPGKLNSVSPKEFDVKIDNANFTFNNTSLGEKINFYVKVKNVGKQKSEFTIQLFEDSNNDNLEDNLLEESQNFNLETNDSIKYNFSYSTIFTVTKQQYLIKLVITDDDSTNNKNWIKIYPGFEKYNIIINEIMHSPVNEEPEWIEIYNRSDKSINLFDYNFTDESTSFKIGKNVIINSNEYYVFADDSLFFNKYPKINNAEIINLPSLNNTRDKIIITDSLNRILDSLEYFGNWGGINGNSLERIDIEKESFVQSNWGESKYSTPGFFNSISKKNKDLQIESISIFPENYLVKDSINISCKIKNTGKEEIEFTTQLFFIDDNSQTKYLVDESNPIFLQSSDSILFNFKRKIKVLDFVQNILVYLNVEDDDTTNNNLYFSINPAFPKSTIIISEIMFLPQNDEPEWIEIYNNSDFKVDLQNWQIGDILTKPVFKEIRKDAFFIEPKSYLVISKDSTITNYYKQISSKLILCNFANLNNDADGIVLKDFRGITIDSVFYTNEISQSGKSIERINKNISSLNSNNWNYSIDLEGGTPGRVNSISQKNIDVAIINLNSIPKNPIKNQQIKFRLLLKNYGEQIAKNINLKIYMEQSTFEEFTIDQISGFDSILVETQNQFLIKDTLTISVIVELQYDEDIINNSLDKKIIAGFNQSTLLFNEIFVRTNSYNQQWIELYSNSDSTINLKNWLIGNGTQNTIVSQNDLKIAPKEILVISDQESNEITDENINIVFSNLPNFNIDKGEIVIYDYREVMIDSIKYEYKKNAIKNISLERISIQNESCDKSNWQNCLNGNGNTIGEINSIENIPHNDFSDLIITEIMFNPNENNSEFIEIFNKGETPIELGGWKIKIDESIFSISDYSLILNGNDYFVISSDSSILNNYSWLQDYQNIKISNISSFGLTNSGKIIYLIDNRNKIIDSVSYSESWHNSAFVDIKNISLELINIDLERIKSSNWSSCVNKFGGTPGRENSIFINREFTESKLNISPNPFSPDNDGYEDFTIISYNLSEPISQIRVRIFDSKGRIVRNLVDNDSVGSSGEIIFNGLDENKNPLRIGIYIILFEALNIQKSVIESIKDVVVVARKL